MEKAVIAELTQGKKHADELKKQLIPNPTNNPTKTFIFLVDKILSSYDNALTQLGFLGNNETKLELADNTAEDSLKSFVSDPDCKDHSRKHASKIRKLSEKWSELVTAGSGTGNDVILDDGYYWRKYGQKAILGATHPRAYYRCTHKNNQGCLATKHVQQTDKDPSIFEVIYSGNHTCTQQRLKCNNDKLGLSKNEEKTILNNEANFKVDIPELNDDPKEENTNFELDDIIPGWELEIDLTETFLNLTPASFKFTDLDVEHAEFDAPFLQVPHL